MERASPALALALLATLSACGESAQLPFNAGVGTDPLLPPPRETLIPTVAVAPATGWPEGAAPRAPAGLAVTSFAAGLEHPRTLLVLPNGDVLVAETDRPPKEAGGGIRAWIMGLMMKRAGSGKPSANRVTLLRDADGDGVAETRTVFLDGLNSPFGMALAGDAFYVADTDAVRRFSYREGVTRIDDVGATVAELPAGPRNHHWTKGLVVSPDGKRLYASVGSNSNVGENGLEAEAGRAAIWEIDAATGAKRLFASGLRNPVALAWEPSSGELWTVVNERDEIGSDLVPDYLTSVRDGAFYGWPWSYFGGHVDARVQPPRPDLVATAVKPDYALGTHVAPLGLAFTPADAHARGMIPGAVVGQHGSWNRRPRSGYNVVFIPFGDGRPAGAPVEVLSGFVDDEGNARGRPVGVALDHRGGLLVADDVGNRVWRVAPERRAAAAQP